MHNSVAMSTFTMLYYHHLYQMSKYFHHPQRKPHTHEVVTSHSSLSPVSDNYWECFLSVWIYLFWICLSLFSLCGFIFSGYFSLFSLSVDLSILDISHGITQYVNFCVYLLSLSMTLLRFIHVVVFLSAAVFPFHIWIIFYYMYSWREQHRGWGTDSLCIQKSAYIFWLPAKLTTNGLLLTENLTVSINRWLTHTLYIVCILQLYSYNKQERRRSY